jgi:hypothetical protein
MIPATLALAMMSPAAAPHREGHGLAELEPNVEAIVARAWQEQGEADKRHLEDLKNDREMGQKYSAEVEKELKLSTDAAMNERIARIGQEIAQVANVTPATVTWGDKRLNPFEYQFRVVEDEDINAFSLPGGFIYVYDGLIKAAESDDELAGVLAHEVAHASFRHVATLQREQSRLQSFQIPLILLAILTGGAGAAGTALGGSSLLSTAISSGWSVRAEQSADYGALQYLLKTKYDPTGLLTFMERLARNERKRPIGGTGDIGIYRTHPPSRERAESITRYMRSAEIPIRRSRVAASCRVEVKPHEDGTVAITFNDRTLVALGGAEALERADRSAQRINAFFDSEPEVFEMRSSPEGQVVGGRQVLLDLAHEDAVANNTTVSALVSDATQNLKRAVASLSYRIWNYR